MQRRSNALDKKAQSSRHNKHHAIITSLNIFYTRQDHRLLLLLHCQIYIEMWRQRFKRQQIVLKYIRTIKMLTKWYIIKIEHIAKRFTFRISLTISLTIIIFLRMSFWIFRDSSLWVLLRWFFTRVAVINFL